MLPGPDEKDLLQRGQLPVFIPNYYRGAWQQFPRTAGRSSQLFNTGTASWFYRIVIEQLFGVKGCEAGLKIQPQLPSDWDSASISRDFRGACFNIRFRRNADIPGIQISVDGQWLEGQVISGIKAGNTYEVEVLVSSNSV
jgi:cellobionic acid phosphorylase